MTDHAPSVAAPALDEALERVIALHHDSLHSRAIGWRVCDYSICEMARAALRAESVAAPPLDEPTLTRALGEVAKVVGGDLLEGGVKHRIGLAYAILEQLPSAALHAPPALDAALRDDLIDELATQVGSAKLTAKRGEPIEVVIPLARAERLLARLRAATPASGEPAAPQRPAIEEWEEEDESVVPTREEWAAMSPGEVNARLAEMGLTVRVADEPGAATREGGESR